MAYKLAVKIATKSACYNDPRKMQGPLGAMLHSVGCSQPFREYVYDVQVTFESGAVKTVIPKSSFVVAEEVTYE